MECGEFRARTGPQALGENPAGLLVRHQGVGLSAVRAQGPDELGAEGLVVRVRRGEFSELRYEARTLTAPEVGLDA